MVVREVARLHPSVLPPAPRLTCERIQALAELLFQTVSPCPILADQELLPHTHRGASASGRLGLTAYAAAPGCLIWKGLLPLTVGVQFSLVGKFCPRSLRQL